MGRLRIAHISYLNSAPFFAGMDDQSLEMIDLHPRALGEAARRGDIDAGLMSIADTFRNPEFEPLGDLGIALDGPSHSVLLFSASPVRRLDGATIGITAETSRRAVELAQQYPNVYAVVGIQPNYVAELGERDWQQIEELAVAPNVVGIGETGLDRYWDYAPIAKQAEYFTRHIELAKKLSLPFIVHCRDAEADVVAQLRKLAAGGTLSSFTMPGLRYTILEVLTHPG